MATTAATAVASSAAAAGAATSAPPAGLALATLAGGCFWCVEAPYSDLKGVSSAISGYIGGHVPSPTYRAVCDGTTGHAEAVRITYDPAVISFSTLLDVFFVVHDPTQLNRQGADAGTQYRSAIFYHGAEQRAEAEAKMRELAGSFPAPIVTQLDDASAHVWYPAEDYHQRYAARNPTQGYVVAVGQPKYRKAYAKFAKLFKD
jgi:peptide-methionine (S)-S-oxide reductase